MLTNYLFKTDHWNEKRVRNTVGRWKKTVAPKKDYGPDNLTKKLNQLWKPKKA